MFVCVCALTRLPGVRARVCVGGLCGASGCTVCGSRRVRGPPYIYRTKTNDDGTVEEFSTSVPIKKDDTTKTRLIVYYKYRTWSKRLETVILRFRPPQTQRNNSDAFWFQRVDCDRAMWREIWEQIWIISHIFILLVFKVWKINFCCLVGL